MTYEFNETIGIGICLCSRVGGEWEFTDFVCDTGSFELFFILTDPCDFGVGVDDRGDGIVVDVSVTCLDVFNSGDTCLSVTSNDTLLTSRRTLLLGLVGEHGTKSDISNSSDTFGRSVELVVNDDSSTLVHLDSDSS